MNRLIKNGMILLILTMILLGSYEYTAGKIKNMSQTVGLQSEQTKQLSDTGIYIFSFFKDSFQEVADTFRNWDDVSSGSDETIKDSGSEYDGQYRAVWISYEEFNAFRVSTEKNNAKNFRIFFRSILENCKEMNFNTVIVQVRPFGDALYYSEYYPWAASISGERGKSPGYDPLEIMVKEAHKEGLKIEAWINPYRIGTYESIDVLPDGDIAKKWKKSEDNSRNVLKYESTLYYNPSSKDVQKLIVNGVKEIVKNYDIDGIHMDDYFYPKFTKMNYSKVFDSKEYKKYKENNVNKKTKSIENWRRNNVNELVKEIYKTCHKYKKTFGISPEGNLNNLRSNYGVYADVDTWVSEKGYIDYVTPQIYWGFMHEIAPFQAVFDEWSELLADSDAALYIGLQLHRMDNPEEILASDYEEMLTSNCFEKQLEAVAASDAASGFSIFSYQYLDVDDNEYLYDTVSFLEDRKVLLRECKKLLVYLQY